MASKILLISLLLLAFPMMFIPGIALKFPPLYQVFLLLLVLLKGLEVFLTSKINKELLKYSLLLLLFCIYLFFNNSQLSQIISISSYILILLVMRFEYAKTIYLNKKIINNLLAFLYYFFMSYAIIQVIIFYLFDISYLLDFKLYLTSELFNTNPMDPNQGWNRKFRPSSFFAEPSFFGFYIALYTIFRFDNNYKFPFTFLIFNILILHLMGNRSGEVILICMFFFINFEKLFGKQIAIVFFSITLISIFVLVSYFSQEILLNVTLENTDGSIVERIKLFMMGIEIYQDHILFGIGLGNVGNYIYLNELYNYPIANLVNMYLQFLTEVGTIGLLILIYYFKKLFTYSYSTIALLMLFFLLGGYALFYIFLFSLFNSIYLQESYSENFISK